MSEFVDTAKRVAALAPTIMFPCPLCTAQVRGANLDRHLAKVHPDAAMVKRPAERSWHGPERLIIRPLTVVLLVALAATAGSVWVLVTNSSPWSIVVLSVALLIAAASGILIINVSNGAAIFHGRLSARGTAFVLSHTFGLRSRELIGVDQAVARPAYDIVIDESGSRDVRTRHGGICLTLRGGTEEIIVRGPDTGFRETWTAWDQGPPSWRCHITLTRTDFVALQYTLAELGHLRPRTPIVAG